MCLPGPNTRHLPPSLKYILKSPKTFCTWSCSYFMYVTCKLCPNFLVMDYMLYGRNSTTDWYYYYYHYYCFVEIWLLSLPCCCCTKFELLKKIQFLFGPLYVQHKADLENCHSHQTVKKTLNGVYHHAKFKRVLSSLKSLQLPEKQTFSCFCFVFLVAGCIHILVEQVHAFRKSML